MDGFVNGLGLDVCLFSNYLSHGGSGPKTGKAKRKQTGHCINYTCALLSSWTLFASIWIVSILQFLSPKAYNKQENITITFDFIFHILLKKKKVKMSHLITFWNDAIIFSCN